MFLNSVFVVSTIGNRLNKRKSKKKVLFLVLWYIHGYKWNDMCHIDGKSILKSMFYAYTLFVSLLFVYYNYFLGWQILSKRER